MRPELVRDAGIRRASTATKWIGVGAVALVGALAGFVANAKPGHSTTGQQKGAAGAAGAPSSPSVSVQPGSGTESPGLTPPPAPPVPVPSSPGIVSGGS